MQERRECPRHLCQVDIVYTLSELEATTHRCIGRNICAEGINLILDRELVEDSIISMSFLLPDDRDPVSLSARVIWAQKLDKEKYHAGVEFVNISVSNQAKIIAFVVKNEPFLLFDQDHVV